MEAELMSAEQEYRDRLSGFDWMYAYSDDGEVYRRGRTEMARLCEMQRKIDPDWVIWRLYDRR